MIQNHGISTQIGSYGQQNFLFWDCFP